MGFKKTLKHLNSYHFGVTCLLIITILFSLENRCFAAEKEKKLKWSFGPVGGLHKPSLKLLNEGEFKSPIIFEDISEGKEFTFRNPLSELGIGREFGGELQWNISDRNAMVIGGSLWEKTSKSTVSDRTFPLADSVHQVSYERTGKFSYNQIYIGWQFNVLSKPKKYRLFTKLSFNEIFDVTYDEKFVFSFPPTATAQDFKRIISLKSRANGVFSLQFGLGGEIFIFKRLSLKFEGSYFYGINKFNLVSDDDKTDFQSTDDVRFKAPLQPDSGGKMRYLREDGTFQPLDLSLNGWKSLLMFNVYLF